MEKKHIPLGTYIRDLRMEKDISLRELAKAIGCSPAFLSDVEHARRFPTDETFQKIAKALGISASALKEYDSRPPVEDIRKRMQSDPTYAYALRKVLDAGASSDQLLDMVKKLERKRETK